MPLSDSPQRKIFLSDTFGGPLDPRERMDADVLLCTHFRSEPLQPLNLKVDTFGQERVSEHILRLVSGLHAEVARNGYLKSYEKERFEQMGTGVLVNAAPRDSHQNGEPFYVADFHRGIRVVTTPLSALSTVKDQIARLRELPNEDNGLYSNSEQFRSSYAGFLLDPHSDERFALKDRNLEDIPDEEDAWSLAYVDRFGNCVTYTPDAAKQWSAVEQEARKCQGQVRLKVGNVMKTVTLGTSLGSSEPGELLLYGNGNIDFVRKWVPRETAASKLSGSAYAHFERPTIGDPVSIVTR